MLKLFGGNVFHYTLCFAHDMDDSDCGYPDQRTFINIWGANFGTILNHNRKASVYIRVLEHFSQ